MMLNVHKRIARKLAEFRQRNTEPDYDEEARVILSIVHQERLAEIHAWREETKRMN